MSMAIQTDPVPLKMDEDGAIRVGGTRMTLDLVIAEHRAAPPPSELPRITTHSRWEMSTRRLPTTFITRPKSTHIWSRGDARWKSFAVKSRRNTRTKAVASACWHAAKRSD